MSFELHQLRQVIALAEHGSFVRAAAALHISQPALSRSIQSLERRFGSDLFLRGGSGVVPTDLGRLYLERARELLRMADELEREAVSGGALRTGRVTVGGGVFASEAVLGRAAARFSEQFSGVALEIRTDDWDNLLMQLRSRELDFFVAETSTLQKEPDIDIAPMPVEHPLYFTGRRGHPLTESKAITLVDVFNWPFVSPSRIPPRVLEPILAAHRKTSRGADTPRPFPAIRCNGLTAVKRIIASSNAISGSILSTIARELEAGDFILLGTEPWLHLRHGIVSLKGRPWTQTADKLRDLVVEADQETAVEEQLLAQRFAAGRLTALPESAAAIPNPAPVNAQRAVRKSSQAR